MVFAIILDFENPKRDYSQLYDKIKSLGAWMHYIESTWFVAPPTTRTANDIFKELRPFVDEEEDYLLIIEVKRSYQGLLPDDAWDWMEKRVGV